MKIKEKVYLCIFSIVFAIILGTVVMLIGHGNTGNTNGFNPIARQFGGTVTINLESNRKLVNVSWKKDDSLWILTRKMRKDEEAETYEYKEDSAFGVIEGTVVVIEHKE